MKVIYLWNDCDLMTQVVKTNLVDVNIVYDDVAFGDFDKSKQSQSET